MPRIAAAACAAVLLLSVVAVAVCALVLGHNAAAASILSRLVSDSIDSQDGEISPIENDSVPV